LSHGRLVAALDALAMKTDDFLLDLERQLVTAARQRSTKQHPPQVRRLSLAAVAVTLVVGVVAAVVSKVEGPPGTAQQTGGPGNIGLLPSPRTPEDRALAARIEDRQLDAEIASTARIAVSRTNGERVWVHRKDDQVCVVFNAPGGAYGSSFCTDTAAVASGQALTLSMRGPDGFRLIGVLPDGPEAVTLGLADGSEVRHPLERNVFIHRGPQPVRLSWTGPDGQESTSVGSAAPVTRRRVAPGPSVNPPRP